MWELGNHRGVGALVLALVLVLLTSTAAVAAPGNAHLVVRGPLELEGPLDLDASGAALLLRDEGHEGAEGLRFDLAAENVRAQLLRIQQECVAAPHAAQVQLPPLPDRLSRLGVGDTIPLDVVTGTVEGAVAEGAGAIPVAGEAIAVAQEGASAVVQGVTGIADSFPIPLPSTDPLCLAKPLERGEEERQIFHLDDATLEVTSVEPGYTLFWQDAGDDEGDARHGHHGTGTSRSHASLDTGAAEVERLNHGREVRPVARTDMPSWNTPNRHLERGLLATTAPAGHGSFDGSGEALLYRAEVVLKGLRDGQPFERTFRTGEERQPGPGHETRTLTFLVIDLDRAQGYYESPAPVELFGRTLSADLDGALGAPDAHGPLNVGNTTLVLTGGAARLEGQLAFQLRGADDDDVPETAHRVKGARGGYMALDVEGDVQRVQHAGVTEQFPAALAQTAAAVSAFAVLAGLLAYFWPALRFAFAGYTRIPTDSVLLHQAREHIYKLIREEPGIHAHEVASRLTLGWGTTVYHLKLLERNGLVVARREGRYKRFFCTGDQRIQHKDAVALLRNATSRSIAGAIATNPGLIQKQVCQALGVSPSLASWHLQRLERAGVVTAERMGRTVRYHPGPAWLQLQALATAA